MTSVHANAFTRHLPVSLIHGRNAFHQCPNLRPRKMLLDQVANARNMPKQATSMICQSSFAICIQLADTLAWGTGPNQHQSYLAEVHRPFFDFGRIYFLGPVQWKTIRKTRTTLLASELHSTLIRPSTCHPKASTATRSAPMPSKSHNWHEVQRLYHITSYWTMRRHTWWRESVLVRLWQLSPKFRSVTSCNMLWNAASKIHDCQRG